MLTVVCYYLLQEGVLRGALKQLGKTAVELPTQRVLLFETLGSRHIGVSAENNAWQPTTKFRPMRQRSVPALER